MIASKMPTKRLLLVFALEPLHLSAWQQNVPTVLEIPIELIVNEPCEQLEAHILVMTLEITDFF